MQAYMVERIIQSKKFWADLSQSLEKLHLIVKV